VYVRSLQGRPGIWSVAPEGGTPRKVVEGGRNPNWSSDGKRLVFEREYDIWVANADGGDQHKLEGVPSTDNLLADRMPSFSPDGSLIAFFQNDKGPIGDYSCCPGGQAGG
jgi:Tol biopolymer transport system component